MSGKEYEVDSVLAIEREVCMYLAILIRQNASASFIKVSGQMHSNALKGV